MTILKSVTPCVLSACFLVALCGAQTQPAGQLSRRRPSTFASLGKAVVHAGAGDSTGDYSKDLADLDAEVSKTRSAGNLNPADTVAGQAHTLSAARAMSTAAAEAAKGYAQIADSLIGADAGFDKARLADNVDRASVLSARYAEAANGSSDIRFIESRGKSAIKAAEVGRKALAALKISGSTLATDLMSLQKALSSVQATTAPVVASGGATLQAAIDLAKAAADDAQEFSDKANALLSTDKAGATDVLAKFSLSEQAIYVDTISSAAGLAKSFSDLAGKATNATASQDLAALAVRASELTHTALTDYLAKKDEAGRKCVVQELDSNKKPIYKVATWLPLVGRGCNSEAVRSYYNVPHAISVGNQVQYLYDNAQSSNQLSADLLTTVFPFGFQVVLTGTATAGSSQPAASVTGVAAAATPAATTDSVANAVTKLKQGGDFSLRLSYPLAQRTGSTFSFASTLNPRLGFILNGISAQSTITESTSYTGNVPIETYAEFGSIPDIGTPAIFYADVIVGGQFLQADYAKAIGTSQSFFMAQAAGGIEFAKSFRVGFQYFHGPMQAYCVPSTTGCTQATSSVSGVNLVMSFSPGTK